MTSIIEKLHKDHLNFQKLLVWLEEQLLLLERREYCELENIHDAIRYMKEYPDYVHHPLEDVVFHYFLEHNEDQKEIIMQLLGEHEKMPELTNQLLSMLEAAILERPQDRGKLCENLRKYITVQKEHMDKEEVYVYPVIKYYLKYKDWNKIKSDLASVEDPIFGDKVKKTYQNLLDKVTA